MKRNKKNKTHIFTSRDKNAGGPFMALIIVLLLFFTLCSGYAIALAPSSPASWSMLAFFLLGFLLLVGYEDNLFPDINKSKMPHAVVVWLCAFIFVAFLVGFVATLNAVYLFLAILFGFPVFVLGSYVVMTPSQWESFKKNTGGKVKGNVKKKLSQRKKKSKKKKKKRRIGGW